MSLPDPHEEALDALITASLHLHEHGPTDEEIRMFLENPPVLPEDQRRALAQFEPDLFGESRSPEKRETQTVDIPATENQAHYLAMNRKNAEDVCSEETSAELDRKRREALEKLKPRPKPPEKA